MAVTQDDFSVQRARAYAGQAADTSPQINDTKTVAEGSQFSFGEVAAASDKGDSFCAKFDGTQTYFEGLVARYFRKDHYSMGNNGGYNYPSTDTNKTVLQNPDSVDLSIMGAWFVVPSEAITTKGQVAVNDSGEFVEAKAGMWAIAGASYEETGIAGEPLKIRLTGGRLITQIEGTVAPAPEITTPPSDASVATGTDASFSVVATNTNTYSWSVDGSPTSITGDDTDSITVDTTGMTAGDYDVTVTCTGDGGSTDSTATLTITA